MAQLYINTVTATSFKWSVQGLSSAFTSTNYTSIGISRSYFTSGTTTRPNVMVYTQSYTGTTSTSSITSAHGLSPGTYTLYGFTAAGGKYYSCGSVTITVPTSDSSAPTIGEFSSNVPSHGWCSTSTVNFVASIYDYGTGVASVNCNFNGTSKTSTSGVNGYYTMTFNTPVTPGSYTVTWAARDNAGNRSEKTTTYWIGYDVSAPTIVSTDIQGEGGSVRAGVDGKDTMSGVASITFKISPPGTNGSFAQAKTYYFNSTASAAQYHSFTVDANGSSLATGKRYYVEVTVMDTAENYVKQVLSVVFSGSAPDAWTWTSAESDAFNNNGKVSTLTYQRWNAFCDFVLSLARWYFGSDADTYNIGGAKLSSDSKTLTATKFNLVKNAVGAMATTGIADVKTGDPVLGSYFLTLSSKANSVKK